MRNDGFDIDIVRVKLQAGDGDWLQELSEHHRPMEIAELVGGLSSDEVRLFLSFVDPHSRSDIFAHFDEETQATLVQTLSLREFAQIVTDMSHDKRADLLNTLPEIVKDRLLRALAHAEREDIRRLASYPEGLAGAVMTSDYTTLSPSSTAAGAVEQIRRQALDRETIYYSYVVDGQRHLLGVLSLKELILAPPLARIEDIMNGDIIIGHVSDDQEDIAQKIQKFDLLALPIVSKENVLLGIVTHDDASDIISQEYTEDVEKLMAITGSHKVGGYLKSSAWRHFHNRCYWVVALAFLGMVSGYIIHQFEATLTHAVILALYLPMLADTGGNVGSQSATVVIRALALKEISFTHFFQVVWKEFRISMMTAGVLAVIAWGKVYFLSRGASLPPGLSLAGISSVVALALTMQVISSTLIGAVLPLAAHRFRLDPALIASPALTTIVDATGLLIYFSIAKVVIGV